MEEFIRRQKKKKRQLQQDHALTQELSNLPSAWTDSGSLVVVNENTTDTDECPAVLPPAKRVCRDRGCNDSIERSSSAVLPALVRCTVRHPTQYDLTGTSFPSTYPADVSFSAYALDVETTGFSSASDEIIEIALTELRWHAWHEEGDMLAGQWVRGAQSFHSLVCPTGPISEYAAKVHGMTADSLRDEPRWPDVAKQLVTFLSGELPASQNTAADAIPSLVVHLPPLIAHNAGFDAAFIEVCLQRAGYRVVWHPLYPMTCTGRLMRALYPKQAADLDAACRFFDIPGSAQRECSPHSALLDARQCGLLFLSLVKAATVENSSSQ